MRKFRIRATGAVVNEDEYRVMHPNVSFARGFAPRGDAEEVVPNDASKVQAEIFAHNAPILAMLAAIDAKSIRPLREGDAARVAMYEAEAAALRSQLRKV